MPLEYVPPFNSVCQISFIEKNVSEIIHLRADIKRKRLGACYHNSTNKLNVSLKLKANAFSTLKWVFMYVSLLIT